MWGSLFDPHTKVSGTCLHRVGNGRNQVPGTRFDRRSFSLVPAFLPNWVLSNWEPQLGMTTQLLHHVCMNPTAAGNVGCCDAFSPPSREFNSSVPPKPDNAVSDTTVKGRGRYPACNPVTQLLTDSVSFLLWSLITFFVAGPGNSGVPYQ
jgi:hypothetical protein